MKSIYSFNLAFKFGGRVKPVQFLTKPLISHFLVGSVSVRRDFAIHNYILLALQHFRSKLVVVMTSFHPR